ncbi:MAG: glycosyltransferase family 2 protein [Bifidobacteriaceae bacterium]|jgi:glycosyltransferase involved in cell wall biosynthesis|nr:glycosyltransferase family 2 protein [Bifidobacteriaceae bacterium]
MISFRDAADNQADSPVLTMAVPAYNAAQFLLTALRGLARFGPAIEVLVVDDGSNDTTGELADQYAARHPGVIRAIHQPNKGHGGAVNPALDQARGTYFKVLDADDRLDPSALASALGVLAELERQGGVDLVISNYVFEPVGRQGSRPVRFRGILPLGQIFAWDGVGRFGTGQFLTMRSLMPRTAVLRRSGIRLPERTYYVDHLFVTGLLPSAERLYYADADLYRYRIGLPNQSVGRAQMTARVDQQVGIVQKVTQGMPQPDDVPEPLYRYLVHHADILCALTSAMLAETTDGPSRRAAMWARLAEDNPESHRQLRRRLASRLSSLPSSSGRH